jgi:hypothetical protein
MNIQAIITSLIPVLLAAIGFLITSINGIENRMYQAESKLMQLISPDGQVVPSPENAFQRQVIREEFMLKYMETLNRLTLLEEKMKEHKERNH